jgi:(1->4)-alpha-D-glucan 1-alpha-D-glucosylmutase
LIAPGRINSLSQVLLKVTAPGIPDIYQGTEIWDLSLVDPDNRRPVDYGLRRSLLAEAVRLPADRVWARADEGLPKLFLTHRALQLRAERPHAFGGSATYEPLKARGPKEKHVVAFTRSDEVIAVAPRLVMTLGGDWADTFLPLPQGVWRDVLGGRRFSGSAQLSELTHDFPVALLARG